MANAEALPTFRRNLMPSCSPCILLGLGKLRTSISTYQLTRHNFCKDSNLFQLLFKIIKYNVIYLFLYEIITRWIILKSRNNLVCSSNPLFSRY